MRTINRGKGRGVAVEVIEREGRSITFKVTNRGPVASGRGADDVLTAAAEAWVRHLARFPGDTGAAGKALRDTVKNCSTLAEVIAHLNSGESC